MSKERRRYERFSLILTGLRITDANQEAELEISQLSIGSCFTEWFEEAYPGYIFKMKLPLIDDSFLLLTCRVRYSYRTVALVSEFVGITNSEQEKIAELIMSHLWKDGVPEQDPFTSHS